MWLTPLLWYPEPPRRVGYSTYGFWLIYSVAEIALFSIFRALRTPSPSLVLICETLRISLLILLLCVTFGARINPYRKASLDEESSPLLSPEAPQPATNGTAYGSCNAQSNGSPTNHSKTYDSDSSKSSSGKKENGDAQKVWGFWDFVDCFKVCFCSVKSPISRVSLTFSSRGICRTLFLFSGPLGTYVYNYYMWALYCAWWLSVP